MRWYLCLVGRECGAACSGYKANLAAAGESNQRLEARLAQNMRAFSSLSLDNAVALMPRLQVAPLRAACE